MSEFSFFEQEEHDESKLKAALKESERVNGPKRSFSNEVALEILGQQFDFKAEKKKLTDNLEWYQSLSVEEYTFRKKWEELTENKLYLTECGVVKAKIWTPTDLDDEQLTIKQIANLRPKVVWVSNDELQNLWNTLRLYSHSADFNLPPGRFIKFLVLDEDTGKILGFFSIASDVPAIDCRDTFIGWDKNMRITQGKIRHSSIAHTIAATQPFGFNFLGGKLTAALVTTDSVRQSWQSLYGDKLVSLTTTSLYGSYSMYNRLPWWKELGKSKGKIPLKPTEEVYSAWHAHLKKVKTKEYYEAMTQKEGVSGPRTSPKMRILAMIFEMIGRKQKDFVHGYERGVYGSFFYENSKEFLCNKVTEDKLVMKPLFVADVQGVLDWWKPKAIERYKKLKSEGRLNSEKLFYNLMVDMKYEEAKAKYFKDVGR